MTKIRLALVDDHQIVRDGLKALLQGLQTCEVVAEAGDGDAAIALATNRAIDIYLMDISMPGIDGLEAATRILAARPDAKIIMLSMHAAAEYVQRALDSGARGYMLKNMKAGELERALAQVAAGRRYVSAEASDAMQQAAAGNGEGRAGGTLLTTRQREILRLLANGMSTRDIASLLSISSNTVEAHRSQLMRKLEIYDVPGLVKYAVRHGLVAVD